MRPPRRTLTGQRIAPRLDANRGEPYRHVVSLQLLGFTARIASSSWRIVHDVMSLYPTATAEAAGPDANGAPPFAVVERGHGAGGCSYYVSVDGIDIGRFATASDAVAHLEYLMNAAAAVGLRKFLLLHAGAVASARGAIIIPGSSGAGKSTLVTALCLAGLRYLSDELSVIDSASGAARPFLKPICLKEGGWRLLTTTLDLPPSLFAVRVDGQQVHYLRPPHPSPPQSALPIGFILLPVRRSGASANLTPRSRAQTLAELARHSLNLPRHGPAGLELLAQVVESSECYTLTYDTVFEAVATISGLVGHSTALLGSQPSAGE
jgi:hypothetical protein